MCNSQKDNETVQTLSQNVSQKVVNTLLKWFKEDAMEGLEEVFTDIVSKVAQKLTYADKMTWEQVFSTEDAWDAFMSGLLLSRAMSGADAIVVNGNSGLENIAGKLSRGEDLTAAERQQLLDAVLQTTAPETAVDSNKSSRVAEPGKFGKTGWDGRVAVTEATGPNVTVDGVTYKLLGYDENGSKVYQDVEVLESAKENATADQKEMNPTESRLESVENPENHDTINSVEMFKRDSNLRKDFKPLSQKRFEDLTIEVRKYGATIIRGTPEVEAHLEHSGASASVIGDVLMFRSDATIGEVLEETHHFMQNRSGLNADKGEPLRTYLNEIDAKEYIIDNAEKYHVPRNEVELAKSELEYYKNLLKEYNGGEE